MDKQPPGLETLRKYDWQVPRYTSYPPATSFTGSPEESGTLEMIDRSNRIGPRHVSFYFHVPFCPKRCLFCGCQTEIGRTGGFIRTYMDALQRELELMLPLLDGARPVTQIHFGGGTPNAVPLDYLGKLIHRIRETMAADPRMETAIECDPNLLNEEKVERLAELGFNRISMGVQDFDLRVLAAVERRFPKVAPKDLIRVARAAGFRGINLDLMYGLPHQTAETFHLAIDKAIESRPDRISLFPYAHVPWIKGHQERLAGLPMAGAEERLGIAWESRERLMDAGFQPIGMDHFARPDDELAEAARNGGLHRNFQGYCTSARAGQVYALGASGISQLHEGYIRNARETNRYQELVDSGRLSHEAAYRMRPADLVVREIINGLLCNGTAAVQNCLDSGPSDAGWKASYLEDSLSRLAPLVSDGLAVYEKGVVRLTEQGHYASRAVASAFDPMLSREGETGGHRYSRAL